MKFQNNSFTVEAEELPGSRISLKVTVSPEETKKAYKQAVKVINKEISVPGFRKGKAPDATVIKNYGSHVEKEWKEIVLNAALQGALELSTIYPLTKNSLEKPRIETCSLEEGAVVHFAYEHYPQVPTIDFNQLKLPPVEKKEVTEEQIQGIVQEIQRSNAAWEEVTGRSIEEGDYVDLTIESIDEDPPKPIVQDRRFEVSDKRMAPWLTNLLIGKEAGAVVEGMSEVDDKADETLKAKFKPTTVRIHIHGIKKSILPELTDELAKTVGAASIDDLLVKIRANLENEAKEEQKQVYFQELENALIEHCHFPLPSSIIQNEREERLKAKFHELKQQNMSDEEIKGRQKELEDEVAVEVDRSIRLYFIEKQIIRQGNISVSREELSDEISRQFYKNLYLQGRERDEKISQEFITRVNSALMQRKMKEYALAQILENA